MILTVSIEIEGKFVIAGKIEYEKKTGRFSYDAEYIKNDYPAISVSLPIQNGPFTEQQTRNFFEGLLPEGFTRRSIAHLIKVDEDDYLSLLKTLGNECIGAIRIYEPEAFEIKNTYEKLTKERIRKLAATDANTSAVILADTRLSLAGASGKVGLLYDGQGEWYIPHGTAASTHIVKQSHVRLNDIVINEYLVMKTAKLLGLNASNCFIINPGQGSDSEILFASERFDRYYEKPVLDNGNFKNVERLHQEDFSQILGINSLDKYETAGKHYLKDMFDVVRKYSANPIEDSIELWKRLIFDYMVGNADCHLKNFSFVYSRNLKSMRLAPMYDALSTRIYDDVRKDFAFNIGGKYNIDEITKNDFLIASKDAGLGLKMAEELYNQKEKNISNALKTAAKELTDEGLKAATDISEKIINLKYF